MGHLLLFSKLTEKQFLAIGLLPNYIGTPSTQQKNRSSLYHIEWYTINTTETLATIVTLYSDTSPTQ